MQGHLLLAFYNALQPGLFMLSGQDLAGILPLSWYASVDAAKGWNVALSSRGAYALNESGTAVMATEQGIPRAKAIYPPFENQSFEKTSFAAHLSRLLALRARLGVAHGQLYGRFLTHHPGSIALIIALPVPARKTSAEGKTDAGASKEQATYAGARKAAQGKIIEAPGVSRTLLQSSESALLVVCNFSRTAISETLDLTASPLLQRLASLGEPVLATENGTAKHGWGNTVTLALGPWQGAVVLVGKTP
jgi:hypothetical protein